MENTRYFWGEKGRLIVDGRVLWKKMWFCQKKAV